MRNRWRAVLLSLLISSGPLYAAERSQAPPSFDSQEALETWVEANRGFGYPESVQSKIYGHRIYIVWNNPFSGRAATFVHAYRYEATAGRWMLLDSSLIERPEPVSYVYVDGNDEKIVYMGRSGRILKILRLTPRGKVDD